MPSVIPTKFHTLFTIRIPRRKLEVAGVPLFSATSFLSPIFSGFQFTLTLFAVIEGEPFCRGVAVILALWWKCSDWSGENMPDGI